MWNLDETLCIDWRNGRSSRTKSSPGKANTTISLMCTAANQKVSLLKIFKGLNLRDQSIALPGTNFEGIVLISTKNKMEEGIFKYYFTKAIIPSVSIERRILTNNL